MRRLDLKATIQQKIQGLIWAFHDRVLPIPNSEMTRIFKIRSKKIWQISSKILFGNNQKHSGLLKPCREPRVNREVLFIEVSLKCYPEDIFSSCKVWQLQRWENFRHIKPSQLLKAKTCWTKNSWSSGIMSNFWGEFFYVLGGKFFLKILLRPHWKVA